MLLLVGASEVVWFKHLMEEPREPMGGEHKALGHLEPSCGLDPASPELLPFALSQRGFLKRWCDGEQMIKYCLCVSKHLFSSHFELAPSSVK